MVYLKILDGKVFHRRFCELLVTRVMYSQHARERKVNLIINRAFILFLQ